MHNNGFAEKIDVSRIQVQYNNIITAKKTSTIGLEIGMNILKFQMGLPMSENITLSDNLESIQLQVLNDDFRKDFTYSNRIEYSKLETNHILTELDIKNTKVQYLPKLDFMEVTGLAMVQPHSTISLLSAHNGETWGL